MYRKKIYMYMYMYVYLFLFLFYVTFIYLIGVEHLSYASDIRR
jgi:hypothetical protein